MAGRLLEEKKCVQGRNGGATAHFWFLVATQEVVSRQGQRGVPWSGARPSAAAPTTWALGKRPGFFFFGSRSRHQVCVTTWLGWDKVAWVTTGNLSPRSRHRFEVATWVVGC